MTMMRARRGSIVLAERDDGDWYAGEVVAIEPGWISIRFIEHDGCENISVAKCIKPLEAAAFGPDRQGPYSGSHARLLATECSTFWSKFRWIAINGRWESGKPLAWKIGRIRTDHRQTCELIFNDGMIGGIGLLGEARSIDAIRPELISGCFTEDQLRAIGGCVVGNAPQLRLWDPSNANSAYDGASVLRVVVSANVLTKRP